MALSAKKAALPGTDYAVHRLQTTELATHGRFVKLIIIPTESYVFADEIEIHRGPDSLLKKSPGSIAKEIPKIAAATKLDAMVRRRLSADLEALRKNLLSSSLPENARAKLQTELNAIASELPSVRIASPENYRTIFPLNSLHTRIFAAQGMLWRELGLKKVVVWPARRWDMLSPTAQPAPRETQIEINMMRNEFRSAAFNLSNASDQPAKINLVIDYLPGGKNPGYITVHDVPFTDTQSGVSVAAALPLARQENGKLHIEVPSGLTRQVWLTFHPKDVAAGKYSGRIILRNGDTCIAVLPLSLKIFPFTFPDQPTLHLGGWDYTDADNTYQVTPENREMLIRHLREHFVDTPWAQTTVMPPGKYDPSGHMIEPPDASAFRTWVNRWPEARNYFVFSNVGEKFAGFPMGTPEFNLAVTEWINWWAKELPRMKIKLPQLGLLLVDEPREGIHDRIVIAYAKVIRAAQPDIVIFEDPIWNGPWKGDKQMYQLSHILCPNLPMCIEHGEKYLNFYLKQRDAGRRLWFYSCHGPGRLLDPYSYHRMQQWFCWKHGAEGAGFWAFGDSNGASSWNEYLTGVGAYTPLFLDAKSVTGGKQMEAIREGVEDYEYLRMLRDRVEALEKKGISDPNVVAARHLLNTAADRVTACMTSVGMIYWSASKDREVADLVRLEILEALEELEKWRSFSN